MRRDGLWTFYVLSFATTWGIGALYFICPGPLVALFGPVTGPLFLIAVAMPTLMAIAMTAVTAGRAGLADLFARLLRWRVHWRWYALATFGIAAIGLVPQVLAAHFADAVPPSFDFARYPDWLVIGLLGFVSDPGPLGEELGWRGYALPRLEQRLSGLTAALLMGALWGAWHLPAFFIPGLPQNQFPIWAFMVTIVSLAVISTWIVNNARGSVILAILVHWSANRFENLTPQTAPYTAAVFALAALGVVLIAGPGLGARHMPPAPVSG